MIDTIHNTPDTTADDVVILNEIDLGRRARHVEGGGDISTFVQKFEPFVIVLDSGRVYDNILFGTIDVADDTRYMTFRHHDISTRTGQVSVGGEMYSDPLDPNITGKVIRIVKLAYDSVASIEVSVCEKQV